MNYKFIIDHQILIGILEGRIILTPLRTPRKSKIFSTPSPAKSPKRKFNDTTILSPQRRKLNDINYLESLP